MSYYEKIKKTSICFYLDVRSTNGLYIPFQVTYDEHTQHFHLLEHSHRALATYKGDGDL